MKTINPSNPFTLDAKELIEKSHTSNDSKEVQRMIALPSDPSLIWITNLSLITDAETEDVCIAINDITRTNKEHVFLIDEQRELSMVDDHGLRHTNNLWPGIILGSGKIPPCPQRRKTPIWVKVQLSEEFSDFESLKQFEWVIICGKNKNLSDSDLVKIAEIIDYCNRRYICVCTLPYTVLDKIQAAFEKEYPKRAISLRYELPETKEYRLLMQNSAVPDAVLQANEIIDFWTNVAAMSTMGIAYGVYKLRNMARQLGERAFWQTYFKVNSFDSFVKNILQVSKSQAFRYLQAMAVSETLVPGYMKSVFETKKNPLNKKALGYSRFLDIAPYMDGLNKESDENRQLIINKLYDPEVSGVELNKLLRSKFLKYETPSKTDPFDIEKYIKGIELKLGERLDIERRDYLTMYLYAIDHLFDPDAISFPFLVDHVEDANEEIQGWAMNPSDALEIN